MSATPHAKVAIDALRMAIDRRTPPKGLVNHSDRGVHCACRELLEAHGMRQSMSRPCDCCDNAMMESLWAILKKELVHGRTFSSHAEARMAIVGWIEVWYQWKRIHGSIGCVSPKRSRRP